MKNETMALETLFSREMIDEFRFEFKMLTEDEVYQCLQLAGNPFMAAMWERLKQLGTITTKVKEEIEDAADDSRPA